MTDCFVKLIFLRFTKSSGTLREWKTASVTLFCSSTYFQSSHKKRATDVVEIGALQLELIFH